MCSSGASSWVIMRHHGMGSEIRSPRKIFSFSCPSCWFILDAPRTVWHFLFFWVAVCFFKQNNCLSSLFTSPSPSTISFRLSRFFAAKSLLSLFSSSFENSGIFSSPSRVESAVPLLLNLSLSVACISCRPALPFPSFFPFATYFALSSFPSFSTSSLISFEHPLRRSQPCFLASQVVFAVPCGWASLLWTTHPQTLQSSLQIILLHLQWCLLLVYTICCLCLLWLRCYFPSNRRRSAASARHLYKQEQQAGGSHAPTPSLQRWSWSFLLLPFRSRGTFSSAAAAICAAALSLLVRKAFASHSALVCLMGVLAVRIRIRSASRRFSVYDPVASITISRKGTIGSYPSTVDCSSADVAGAHFASFNTAVAIHSLLSSECAGPVTSASTESAASVVYIKCSPRDIDDSQRGTARRPSSAGTPRTCGKSFRSWSLCGAAAATDLPAVRATHGLSGVAGRCSTGCSGKPKRRYRRLNTFLHWNLFSLKVWNLFLLTGLLISTIATCGATRSSTTSSHYYKSSLSPTHHFYNSLSSFYAQSSSVFLYRPSGPSAATLAGSHKREGTCLLSLFEVLSARFKADFSPLFYSFIPVFFLPPGCHRLSVSSVRPHPRINGTKYFTSLTSSFSLFYECSVVSSPYARVRASSRGNRNYLPSRSSNDYTIRQPCPGFLLSFHIYPGGVYVPLSAFSSRVTSPLRAVTGTTYSFPIRFARPSNRSTALSSYYSSAPFLSNWLSWASSISATCCSFWPHLEIPTSGISSVGNNLPPREESALSAVHSPQWHGHSGAGTQTTGRNHRDNEEEEEEESSKRFSYPLGEDAEDIEVQKAGYTLVEQQYDSFVGPPEDESEGQSQQLVTTVQQRTSRFGSLTDPGEPPTPPSKSPFWPSYPPKKVSPLPGGSLPRWHPRSPFHPLQPRGPYYPQPEEEPLKAGRSKKMKENGKEPVTCVGPPEKPPVLPKNYRHWVRDSRYEYPQFTTLTASLKYRRRLKRSSRKLDWRLKNVQFRRMYFAWRRNMRDQELHRWMREKIQWSKRAVEYWKREYSRQEEDRKKQSRYQEEQVSSQCLKETSTSAQKHLAGKKKKSQSRKDQGQSFAGGSVAAEQEKPINLWEAYNQYEKDRERGESDETGEVAKAGPQRQTAKPSTRCSADELLSSASLSGVDEKVPEIKCDATHRSDRSTCRREVEKETVRERRGREKEKDVEDECLEAKDEVESQSDEDQDHKQSVTLRDLTSLVMSSLTPEEIRDIAVNGYRLPPMTAAVASSPIPWWASRKGEHKWRGKDVATNVQSRWVNWANPRRLIEAAVGGCLLPREERGGILEKLRKEGEKLKQALVRVELGEEAAGLFRHPKSREKRESVREGPSLDWWSTEGQHVDEGLREMWKQKKTQQGNERRRQGWESEEKDVESRKAQPDSRVKGFTSAEKKRPTRDMEVRGKRAEVADNQDEMERKSKDCEKTTTCEMEEEKEGKSPSSRCIGPERGRALSTRLGEISKSCQSRSTFTHTAEREDVDFVKGTETQLEPVEEGQSGQEGGSSEGVSASYTCFTRSGSDLSVSLSGTDIKGFLEDKEKQRKAIEAAIDVSLMLGHSIIVKTQGAAVPYDVHSPFVRSHTSSRRRRMRLRGRQKDTEERHMTRQERRLANRETRLKQEEKRKEDAKAARRRAWEESQQFQSNSGAAL